MNIKKEQVTQVASSIIDKLRIETKNNIFLTKKEVKKYSERLWNILNSKDQLSQYETKLEKFLKKKNDDYASVVSTLQTMIPFLVSQTVKMYEKGHLASIFSEDSMTSLANEKILDVLARYREGKVDLKGLKSYYKTAFKNHSQKVYEAHNGTDIRAGIRTVSSDEAMTVAMNMNLHNPEKKYIVNHTMKKVVDFLRNHDTDYNERVLKFNQETVYRQNFAGIIQGLLNGNTAEETCQELNMTNSDYLRQKRVCFDFLKKSMPDVLRDLFSEFEHEEDKRIHVQSVEKRVKRGKEGNKVQESFVIHEVRKGKTSEVSLVAYIRIQDYNGYPLTAPKDSDLKTFTKIVIETNKANKNNLEKVKNKLLELSKTEIIKLKVKKEAESFLSEYSKSLNQYYGSRENAA